jgi:predicted SnoaL-like aldol condensation-catalyzing enzyme
MASVGGRRMAMTAEENKELVRRFAREVLDEGNIDAADRYVAPDFFNHVTGQAGIGPYKETIRFVRTFLNAPNVEDDIVAEGDKVALFLTASGVHDRPTVFHGRSYPATGKPFSARHVHLFRVRDGLLAEHWAIRDDLSMLMELGIVEFTEPA